jgi:hypothetical protein
MHAHGLMQDWTKALVKATFHYNYFKMVPAHAASAPFCSLCLLPQHKTIKSTPANVFFNRTVVMPPTAEATEFQPSAKHGQEELRKPDAVGADWLGALSEKENAAVNADDNEEDVVAEQALMHERLLYSDGQQTGSDEAKRLQELSSAQSERARKEQKETKLPASSVQFVSEAAADSDGEDAQQPDSVFADVNSMRITRMVEVLDHTRSMQIYNGHELTIDPTLDAYKVVNIAF